jgi:hypothetical protein
VSTPEFYVELPVETDAATLADSAITALQAAWPAWVPVDAHLEVVLIEAIALMAQNAAEVAARMPSAALRAFGTKILGVAYLAGSPAATTVTFGLADLLPHTIPDGTQIIIDNYAFQTVGDVSTLGGATIANVPVVATFNGVAQNGLVGASTSGITTGPWVSSITVLATTSGGTDPEDDTAYQDRLSRQLILQAITLITLRDFELWSLNNASVGRAQAITTAARAVSVALTDPNGLAVSAGVKAAVLASFTGIMEVNTTVTMADPTYTAVTIVATVKAYPGFLAADLQARITSALQDFLSPANWGSPQASTGTAPETWNNEPVLRLNKIMEVIGSVSGVNYVVSATINGSAADLTLTGTTFQLTTFAAATITVT